MAVPQLGAQPTCGPASADGVPELDPPSAGTPLDEELPFAEEEAAPLDEADEAAPAPPEALEEPQAAARREATMRHPQRRDFMQAVCQE